MSDDAEVSEEVIRQMGSEIVRLREQLATLSSPFPPVDDSARVKLHFLLCTERYACLKGDLWQLMALIAQEKKRADDAVVERDLIGRRLAASERALQRALAYAPLSLSPTSKSSSTRSSPSQARHSNLETYSKTISGSASGDDGIYDDRKLIQRLREVEKERDIVLLELGQLKQSMRHLELRLSDLEDGLSESDDNDETHEGLQLQVSIFALF